MYSFSLLLAALLMGDRVSVVTSAAPLESAAANRWGVDGFSSNDCGDGLWHGRNGQQISQRQLQSNPRQRSPSAGPWLQNHCVPWTRSDGSKLHFREQHLCWKQQFWWGGSRELGSYLRLIRRPTVSSVFATDDQAHLGSTQISKVKAELAY